jgi:hypothetical protein
MATLSYDFRVVGLRNINTALASIERRFVQHNRKVSQQLGQPERAGSKASAASKVGTQTTALQRAQARGHLEQLKRIEREKRAELAAANATARQREREAKRATAAVERDKARSIRTIEREERRAAKDKARADARAARERERAERRAYSATRKQYSARKQFASSTIGTVGRSAGGALRGAGRFALGATSILGGFAAAGAIQAKIQEERDAAMLANKALGTPGETRDRNELKRDILRQTQAVGGRTGLGSAGAIEALRQAVGISGDLPTAQKLLPFMADISDATGADIGDVGRTAGQIVQSLSTRNLSPEEKVSATQSIMASMAGQAKVGSIEFADLATQMGKVMSATSGFEGNIADLANTMGAISQLAIAGAASSPEEAMTAMLRFRDDMIANSDRFKKLGVNVFADKERTQLRDPMAVIGETLEATGGDLTKTSKLFDIRGQKAFSPFMQAFTSAGGGEEGQKAVMELVDRMRRATVSTGEVKASAAFVRDTQAKKIDMIMGEFTQKVGTELIPAVSRLIPELAKMIPYVADAARWFARLVKEIADNPISSIGKLIAAKVALDLATAGIGSAIKNALVRAITGPAPVAPGGAVTPKPGLGGPTTIGGVLGAAGVGLTVGTLVAASIEAGFIKLFHDSSERTAKTTMSLVDPTMTPEQRAKRIEQAKDQASEARMSQGLLSGVGYAMSALSPVSAAASIEQYARGDDSMLANSPLLQALIDPGSVVREIADQIYGVEARTLESTAQRASQPEQGTKAQERLAASTERATKALDTLAEKAGSVGVPNRGDSPTAPRVATR